MIKYRKEEDLYLQKNYYKIKLQKFFKKNLINTKFSNLKILTKYKLKRDYKPGLKCLLLYR